MPVFRVADLVAGTAQIERAGARPLHKPLDLGEGKRLTSFCSPDGMELRLLQLAPEEG